MINHSICVMQDVFVKLICLRTKGRCNSKEQLNLSTCGRAIKLVCRNLWKRELKFEPNPLGGSLKDASKYLGDSRHIGKPNNYVEKPTYLVQPLNMRLNHCFTLWNSKSSHPLKYVS